MTTDVRRATEEGNVIGIRSACVCTRRKGTFVRHLRSGDASFARSFDSCSSILTELQRHAAMHVAGGEAGEPASRSGKPAQAGGTDTGVGSNGRSAARRVSTLLHKGPRENESRESEKAWRVEETEGGCGLRPCETRELRFGSPHVVLVVAEIGRRRLASNTLGKRVPKRTDRVE